VIFLQILGGVDSIQKQAVEALLQNPRNDFLGQDPVPFLRSHVHEVAVPIGIFVQQPRFAYDIRPVRAVLSRLAQTDIADEDGTGSAQVSQFRMCVRVEHS